MTGEAASILECHNHLNGRVIVSVAVLEKPKCHRFHSNRICEHRFQVGHMNRVAVH